MLSPDQTAILKQPFSCLRLFVNTLSRKGTFRFMSGILAYHMLFSQGQSLGEPARDLCLLAALSVALQQQVAQPVAENDGADAAAEAQDEVEQGGEPLAAVEKQHISEGEAAECGVGAEEADVKKEAARWPDQEGGIGQRSDGGQQQRARQIDEEDIIRPALAEPVLNERAETVARERAAKAADENGADASACGKRTGHQSHLPSVRPSAVASRPESRLPPK